MRAPLWLLMPVLIVAGCDQPPPAAEVPSETCGAERLQGLVGQPEAVVRQMTLPEPARVIRSGQAITADYRRDRLNVEIGKDGRIARIGCF